MRSLGRVLLDHVALAVPDVRAAVPFLVGELGGRERGAGPGGGYRFWQWQYAGGATLEVLEPDGPAGGFLHRFLHARGPGVHHVTFKVPDIHAAMERAAAHGYDVIGFSDAFPGWKEAFLHPRQAQGIVVQLAESDPSLSPDPAEWPFPERPERAPEPVRIACLRLAAVDGERARRQWESLLGGACEARDGELVFTWRDSPLAIAVDVDPGAPEGPRALEVACERPLALPEGPHPVLGAAFVAART